jgi:hypothetical protein
MAIKKFSENYATFEEWQQNARDTAYKRKIERLHGLHPTATLSQLDRHPRKKQKPLGEVKKRIPAKMKLSELTPKERNLRSKARKVFFDVKSGKSLEAASAEHHIKPETVRRHVDGFVKESGRWRVKRIVKNEMSMRIYSRGREQHILVPDVRQASIIGRYNNAVKNFLRTHNESFLSPYVGLAIKDSRGVAHRLETDPKSLYMIWERKPEEQQRPIYDDLG